MARRKPSRGAWLRRPGPAADAEREELARLLQPHELAALGSYYWEGWARDAQLPPEQAWRTWLICAGRGFGKTRAGAEWVRDVARHDGNARIALVGASLTEVRNVMVEGDSGVLAASPGARPGVRAELAQADVGKRRDRLALFGRRAGDLARAAAQPRVSGSRRKR